MPSAAASRGRTSHKLGRGVVKALRDSLANEPYFFQVQRASHGYTPYHTSHCAILPSPSSCYQSTPLTGGRILWQQQLAQIGIHCVFDSARNLRICSFGGYLSAWTSPLLAQLVSLEVTCPMRMDDFSKMLAALQGMRTLQRLVLKELKVYFWRTIEAVALPPQLRHLHIYTGVYCAPHILARFCHSSNVHLRCVISGESNEALFHAAAAFLNVRVAPITRIQIASASWSDDEDAVEVTAWRTADTDTDTPALSLGIASPRDSFPVRDALYILASEHLEELVVGVDISYPSWCAPLRHAARLRRVAVTGEAARWLCVQLLNIAGFLPALEALTLSGIVLRDAPGWSGALARDLPLALPCAAPSLKELDVGRCVVDDVFVWRMLEAMPQVEMKGRTMKPASFTGF
ncbi:hypothetical protein FA95DRAFT_1606935 [Auriscalpium vulgare]|uniref:Uncharacterized protein n=1 Tax=Auriscalpium vulgare TaxID=40419 RepID=A0ACB8RS85_9AGAM|nr:hypothetical protein FA95DRAFT_1606935 [Auriscalpium vulgare]